jgi:chorismate mutase
MDYIKISSDDIYDSCRVYKVLEYIRRDNSTAVELVLEASENEIIRRVVAYHQIEWIEDKDW